MRATPTHLAMTSVVLLIALLAPAEEETKIVLSGSGLRMVSRGLVPSAVGRRVTFTARLVGNPEKPEEFHCLDEVWDWGDGTESVYEPDCYPYEEGTELKRQFRDAHTFRPGRWFVSFALMNGDDVVADDGFEIRIY